MRRGAETLAKKSDAEGGGVKRNEKHSACLPPSPRPSSLPIFPVGHLFLDSLYALTHTKTKFDKEALEKVSDTTNKRSHRRNAGGGGGTTGRENGGVGADEKVRRRYSRVPSTKAKEKGEHDDKKRGGRQRDRKHQDRTMFAAGGAGDERCQLGPDTLRNASPRYTNAGPFWANNVRIDYCVHPPHHRHDHNPSLSLCLWVGASNSARALCREVEEGGGGRGLPVIRVCIATHRAKRTMTRNEETLRKREREISG